MFLVFSFRDLLSASNWTRERKKTVAVNIQCSFSSLPNLVVDSVRDKNVRLVILNQILDSREKERQDIYLSASFKVIATI
jgi:hypothetical protein